MISPGDRVPYLGLQSIVEYIVSNISENTQDLNTEAVDYLKSLLTKYGQKEIRRSQAEEAVMNVVGTISPIDMLDNIMNVDITSPPQIDRDVRQINGRQQSSGRKRAVPWTHREDLRLLAGILHFGKDSWTKISEVVGESRTRAQCSQRWLRGLDPRISKRHWLPSEDKKLLEYVEFYGDTAWAKIASSMGNRSDVQCRYHYQQLMKGLSRTRSKRVIESSSDDDTSMNSDDDETYIVHVKTRSRSRSRPIPKESPSPPSPPSSSSSAEEQAPPSPPPPPVKRKATLFAPLMPPPELNSAVFIPAPTIEAFLHHFGY